MLPDLETHGLEYVISETIMYIRILRRHSEGNSEMPEICARSMLRIVHLEI